MLHPCQIQDCRTQPTWPYPHGWLCTRHAPPSTTDAGPGRIGPLCTICGSYLDPVLIQAGYRDHGETSIRSWPAYRDGTPEDH